MRAVLDTNVVVSGIFFTGPPNRILRAWSRQRFELVLSPRIVDEYQRVGQEMARERGEAVLMEPFLAIMLQHAILVDDLILPEAVCSDPSDDKFLACALSGPAEVVVSGDRALLRASGWNGIQVLRPREFLDTYLQDE